MTAADDLVVDASEVTVRRGRNLLLNRVDWTVELDERWVILGPNGAGKTTLLNLAAARTHPSSGAMRVLGERLGATDVFELRPRVGLASSSSGTAFPGDESVLDAVMTAAWAVTGRGREHYDEMDRERARGLLQQLGALGLADRGYGTLSEGERKRVHIARALMTDPELLLLDEPGAGLDLGARERLLQQLTELALDPDAPAMVLVTHHVEEIPPGFTHALLLAEGATVASGLLSEVLTQENLSKTFDAELRLERYGDRYFAHV